MQAIDIPLWNLKLNMARTKDGGRIKITVLTETSINLIFNFVKVPLSSGYFLFLF